MTTAAVVVANTVPVATVATIAAGGGGDRDSDSKNCGNFDGPRGGACYTCSADGDRSSGSVKTRGSGSGVCSVDKDYDGGRRRSDTPLVPSDVALSHGRKGCSSQE